MSDYTPTTNEVRKVFVYGAWENGRNECDDDENADEFDRWLRKVRAEALREAARNWSDWDALRAPEDYLNDVAGKIERGE